MEIVFIVGNLGDSPEVRMTQSGQKVTSFSLASNKKKAGKDETTWWKVTIFGDRFDKMLPYLKKGSCLIVTGDMDVSQWTDKQGNVQLQHAVIADRIKFGSSSQEKKDEQPKQQDMFAFAPTPF